MAIKQPRLVCGIVVTGTCSVDVLGGASDCALTIPAGTYWCDPMLSGIVTAASAGNVDAAGVLTNLLDAADSGATYTMAYASADSTVTALRAWAITITRSTGTFSIRATNASTNAAGRRFLRFMGFDQLIDDTAALTQSTHLSPAIWDPLRGEDGSPEDEPQGFASSAMTSGGVAYAYDLGNPLLNRMVSFPGLHAVAVKRRADSVDSFADIPVNFETVAWPWLSRGSPVRYWADKNATQNTYLAAAMTAAETSFTLPTNSLLANKTMVCVDGEWMVVRGGIGTTTVSVRRDDPVAHAKYAPVSSDFVGTYILDQSGGNVNLRGFKPTRRDVTDDRWDMMISLARTAGM